jgi:ubiquitin-like-conjugating enzyme ATG3
MSNLTSVFHGIREYWTPVLTESRFESHAVLTPEEFIIAGDYLVYKCGTWRWEAGDATKRRDYLPAEKQYLTTKNGICSSKLESFQIQLSSRFVFTATHIFDNHGFFFYDQTKFSPVP